MAVASDLSVGSPEEQRQVLDLRDERGIKAAARSIKLRDQAAKKAAADIKRKAREDAALAEARREPGIEVLQLGVADHTDQLRERGVRVDLTHADPPWKYDDSGANGAAAKHYELLDMPDIVRDLCGAHGTAKPNSYLLLWVTNPLLAEWFAASFDEATFPWRYVTNLCWRKRLVGDGRGTGRHALCEHELCLLYASGSPKPHTLPPRSAHDAPRGAHSEKDVGMLATLLLAYTPKGALVRDLYAGRAPLARACHATERRYVGCDISADRVRTARAQLALAVGGALVP